MKIQRELKEWHLFFCILALTSFFFWQKDLYSFLFVKNLAGNDLIGNFAFAWIMKRFISNLSFFGWSNLWFGGFPVFEFYPPLFFIVVNLSRILSFNSISLKMSYKLCVLGTLFIFPTLLYFSFRKMNFGKIRSFFVSIFSFWFLFLNGRFSFVHRTLSSGLVTQAFALDLFVLLLPFLFGINEKKEIIVSGILFGLILLSHPFVGLITAMGFISLLFLKRKKWREILLAALLGVTISSGFWLNLLFNLRWMNIYTLGTASLQSLPIVLFPFLAASVKKGKKNIFFLFLLAITLLFSLVNLSLITQPVRFFIFSLFFISILSGLGAFRVFYFIKERFLEGSTQTFVLLLLILAPLLFSVYMTSSSHLWERNLEADEILRYIENDLGEGRILVRRGLYGKSILSEIIPINTGKGVLNELHVDSSVSAPYTLALQHWISGIHKINPVCDLCKQKRVKNTSTIVNSMKKFNVKYIVSYTGKGSLSNFGKFKEKVGKFHVFETPFQSKYYSIPKYKPVLVISSLKDWKKLNKKIFMDPELSNLVFIWKGRSGVQQMNKYSKIFKMGENETVENLYRRIKKNLSLKKIEVEAKIKDFSYTNKRISFKVDSNKKVPVLLKFSYYPKWRGRTEIYMANPSLMLVYGKGKMELSYSNSLTSKIFTSSFS